jgi:rhamnulose-1-phosphate aldolase/alcohol dehydrogenase
MKGNLWDGNAPSEEQPVELVVYRSRLIGSDPELVVWGGGNTSVKTRERDHLGRIRDVMRIKGSGTDLKSIDASGFPGVYLDEVLPLRVRAAMSDDDMVAYLARCMVEPAGRRPSIETLLHAFLPARHVDHTHADAIVALTNAPGGPQAVREALGGGVAYVPYRRPGFALSKEVASVAENAHAVVLANHGLVTWGDTAEASYACTIDLVERAETWLRSHTRATPQAEVHQPSDVPTYLTRMRGRLGRVILHCETGQEARMLSSRPDVVALTQAGPATADHVLRIRPWVCLAQPADPMAAIDAYEQRYREWFKLHAPPDLDMLSALPRALLLPGFGVIGAGRNARDAAITAEVALHSLSVAARAIDAHGAYRPLSDEDLFHVDYWPLELYKLSTAPLPREFEGRIVAITGAGSGIGRAISRVLGSLGAQLALLDINADGLAVTARLVTEEGGPPPLCVPIDLTDEAGVKPAIERVVLAYGGLDGLVSNAGVAASGTLAELTAFDWRRSMEVNATSHFFVTQAAMTVMARQGMGGSIVYIGTKNVFSPGTGFGAYSAAKAAQVQLARVAALEGGPVGIRANVVNPDAVFEDSGLWTPEIRASRAAAHGVEPDALQEFYAQRNVLRTTVSGRDVAETVVFLLSDRSRATTGAAIAVDGGVAGAFPR